MELYLYAGSTTSSQSIEECSQGVCCTDGYNLNYTLPMFDQCTEKHDKNGRTVQTIPKLIPASGAEDAQCRGKGKLGIPPGRRVCQFPACLSSPCENGWCEESMTGYQCHCRAGYIGKRCEDEMEKTSPQPAQMAGLGALESATKLRTTRYATGRTRYLTARVWISHHMYGRCINPL
nr:neurogenic locus notch homolog protein 1-like [Lytechinus pictus]